MTTDWNTVTSDLQRAANNLVWFVLESMTVPDQPPTVVSTMSLLPPTVSSEVSQGSNDDEATPIRGNSTHDDTLAKKKKGPKQSSQPKRVVKSSIGKAVDRLVSETLV